MESMTITQASRTFGVSPRMLRHYEKLGLLRSHRREGYAYRVFDRDALKRLGQILVLRKLRIPLKQIGVILDSREASAALELFRQNIRELTAEIDALETIKGILTDFVSALQACGDISLHGLLLEDGLAERIQSLSTISINFREERSMEKLQNADRTLRRLENVRVLYLPPTTVAAAHHVGDDPEQRVHVLLDAFVRERALWRVKPDLRSYGFNHPNPVDETGYHGYEVWATIPEDMEVPAPLIKKRFAGGLYAAHAITFGDFDAWDALLEWVKDSDKYEFAGDIADQEHMCGLLEEHLNYVNMVQRDEPQPADMQLDLLVPVREIDGQGD